jgi:hypothetical protein
VTRHLRTLVALFALAGTALLTGCGGGAKSNGIDKLGPQAALAKVKAAVSDVKSVHVKGTINQSGQPLRLEVIVGSDSAQGSITVAGGTMDLRLVDGITYFRGDAKVFAAFGANAAQASFAAGRWIKDTSTSGPAASFAGFLDRKQLFDNLLTPQGTVSTGGTATIDGREALILIDNSPQGGKLYVETKGAALPLRIARTGDNGGQIDFTDYNADVSVEAPPGAVDISQLSGG